MAKRFTDTDKWKKTWYRKLRPVHKVFWSYILDNCDNAGIWEVDFELAESFVGEPLSEAAILATFAKQIHTFAGGKRWFLLDFIDFQYGALKPTNNAHKSVISILTRHRLLSVYESHLASQDPNPGADQGHKGPTQGAQDKDKDQDKDQDQDRKGSAEGKPPPPPGEFRLPVRSEEAVAHAAARRPQQDQGERAAKVLGGYPTRSKDGRAVRIDLAAHELLSQKIAESPAYPWEEAASLERLNDTPQDAVRWIASQPDPVLLETRRRQAKDAPKAEGLKKAKAL